MSPKLKKDILTFVLLVAIAFITRVLCKVIITDLKGIVPGSFTTIVAMLIFRDTIEYLIKNKYYGGLAVCCLSVIALFCASIFANFIIDNPEDITKKMRFLIKTIQFAIIVVGLTIVHFSTLQIYNLLDGSSKVIDNDQSQNQ